jgi:hypothetical protein
MYNLESSPPDMIRHTADLFKVLSDDKSFIIFRNIAINTKKGGENETEMELGLPNLGKKSYQKSLLFLIKSNLIAESKREAQNDNTDIPRKHHRYELTEHGQEVYRACSAIEDAVYFNPKLKVLDSLLETVQNNLETDETKARLIDVLIDNHRLKDKLRN